MSENKNDLALGLGMEEKFFSGSRSCFKKLQILLYATPLKRGEEDRWVWKEDGSGFYTVKSAYKLNLGFGSLLGARISLILFLAGFQILLLAWILFGFSASTGCSVLMGTMVQQEL